MAELNHTIVASRDKKAGAAFLTGLLDLPDATPFGPFVVVQTSNGVSLDYADDPDTTGGQHYAFLLTDDEFDAAFARLEEQGVPYGPSPWERDTGEINTNDGGRGVYFDDPSGHVMEFLTVPYGGWSS
ncbi:MAG: VOC family protein [Actinomycetota bacterium]|nr:VOC family protein [Actinomycetota bacterium]